jgi:hypothetical protein
MLVVPLSAKIQNNKKSSLEFVMDTNFFVALPKDLVLVIV